MVTQAETHELRPLLLLPSSYTRALVLACGGEEGVGAAESFPPGLDTLLEATDWANEAMAPFLEEDDCVFMGVSLFAGTPFLVGVGLKKKKRDSPTWGIATTSQ